MKGKESDKSVREGKEKGVKDTGGFMTAEKENLTEISEESGKKKLKQEHTKDKRNKFSG